MRQFASIVRSRRCFVKDEMRRKEDVKGQIAHKSPLKFRADLDMFLS